MSKETKIAVAVWWSMFWRAFLVVFMIAFAIVILKNYTDVLPEDIARNGDILNLSSFVIWPLSMIWGTKRSLDVHALVRKESKK